MDWTFDANSATILLGFLSTAGYQFINGWLNSTQLKPAVKFALALLYCAVAAGLTMYITHGTFNGINFFVLLTSFFGSAHAFYSRLFAGRGFEAILFPKAALAARVKEAATAEVSQLSTEVAADVLSPTTDAGWSLQVNAGGDKVVSGHTLITQEMIDDMRKRIQAGTFT